MMKGKNVDTYISNVFSKATAFIVSQKKNKIKSSFQSVP